MKKTDTARWRAFCRKVQDIKTRNAKQKPGDVECIVDEAVCDVRAERRTKGIVAVVCNGQR